MTVNTKVPAFRYVGPTSGLLPALQAASAIVLTGRLSPAQVAEHNAFIDAMRDEDSFGHIDEPSRFVGVTSGLNPNTRI